MAIVREGQDHGTTSIAGMGKEGNERQVARAHRPSFADAASACRGAMSHFPDQMHIHKIRSALWNGREYGHAAVMVGAGFSLNARRRSPSSPGFPKWNHLSEQLVADLYPQSAFSQHDRENAVMQVGSTSGALRIAQEYEAAFGRNALDAFLRREIPDEQFDPGDLHRLLIKLPWSDIFTTNYDTLLERATDGLVDRKYDVVATIQDIPGSMKPRLVKLHGSFPSTRPFIITEEDFRTYPRKFGPFVNLTQQSIMENVFCLIGFSGEDPNFLYWTGWVRDNLGPWAPRIYLVGLLSLTPAQRNLLQERNVVPIDLSTLPLQGFPSEARHAKALEWFLRNLEYGEPPSPLAWPYPRRAARTAASDGLPPISGRDESLRSERVTPASDAAGIMEQLPGILRQWQADRKAYPGWLIAPAELRDAVWRGLERPLPSLLGVLPSLPPTQRLEVLAELNWLLELCLVPLWPDIASSIVETLKSVNPFPDALDLPNAVVTPQHTAQAEHNWVGLSEQWIELAAAILRYARESQDLAAFEEWRSKLEKHARASSGLASHICYQRCLLALGRLDSQGVRSVLDEWQPDEDDPIWGLRRAAVFAEIGDAQDAMSGAEAALARIRRSLRPDTGDIAALSREGWAMRIVALLDHRERPDFRGRWEKLATYRCNPAAELELLEARLQRPAPHERHSETEIPTFDPGRLSECYHMGGRWVVAELLPALQAVRLAEEAPYPPNCAGMRVSKSLLITAAEWLEPHFPEQTMAILLRTGDTNDIHKFLSRHRLAAMPAPKVADLHELVVNALPNAVTAFLATANSRDKLRAVALGSHMARLLQLLSRLVVRIPESTLAREFDRAIELYVNPAVRQWYPAASDLTALFERLLQAARKTDLADHLLQLMSLPIAGVDRFDVSFAEMWPEPAEYLLTRQVRAVRGDAHDADWTKCIRALIETTRTGQDKARGCAIMRLVVLYRAGILREAEVAAFKDSLWNSCSQGDLPRIAPFMESRILRLPGPARSVLKKRFKQHHLRWSIPLMRKEVRQPDGTVQTSMSFGSGGLKWCDEIVDATRRIELRRTRGDARLIDWTEKEAAAILDKLENWWREEGRALCSQPSHAFVRAEVDERVKGFLKVIRVVVGPRCTEKNGLASNVHAFVSEIGEAGFPVEDALVSMLPARADLCPTITARIRSGLVSQDNYKSRVAFQALLDWLQIAATSRVAPPPPDLVAEIGSIVATRRKPAIHHALAVSSVLVGSLSQFVHQSLVDSLCVGLRYLLEETQYSLERQTSSAAIPYDLVPEYRTLAAELAYSLSESRLTDDPIIAEWLKVAADDPLPEIRRAVTPEV
ncbi:MAG: SIR2 family protein [Pirellulales bacterium]